MKGYNGGKVLIVITLLLMVPLLPVVSYTLAEGTWTSKLENAQATVSRTLGIDGRGHMVSSTKNGECCEQEKTSLGQPLCSYYSQVTKDVLEKLNHPMFFMGVSFRIVRLVMAILFLCGGELFSLLMITLSMMLLNEMTDFLSQHPVLLVLIPILCGAVSALPTIIAFDLGTKFVGPIGNAILFILYLLFLPLMILWVRYLSSIPDRYQVYYNEAIISGECNFSNPGEDHTLVSLDMTL